jgi:hypothetical protein
MSMWNIRKYSAVAVVGAGIAFAAASPASACGFGWGGAYGSTVGFGGCGAYGYAAPVSYGYGGGWGTGWGSGWGGAYGYAPIGYGGGCGAYGYAPISYGCGGYGAYGYAPTYGYASYGYAPAYGSAYGYGGWGCGRHHRHAHAAYGSAVVAFHHPAASVYAARRFERTFAYARPVVRHNYASHVVARHYAVRHLQNLKLARAD